MNRGKIAGLAALTFVAIFQLAPARPVAVAGEGSDGEAEALSASSEDVFYPGCNSVRAAGRAPLFEGQPGYREDMDGDGDGVACEPHRGRGF